MPSQGLEQVADCGCSAEDTRAASRGPGAIWRSPPQSADSTPQSAEHLCQGGTASLTVSCLGPAVETTIVSGEGSLPVAQEGSMHLRLSAASHLAQAGFLLLCVCYGPGGFPEVPAEELSPGSLGYFHCNSVPLRMPSSACVGMTHLALVIGKSLSLMKRHWTRTSQPPLQPLPGSALPQHRQDLTSSHQEMHK